MRKIYLSIIAFFTTVMMSVSAYAVDIIVGEVEKQFVDAQQWIVLIFF